MDAIHNKVEKMMKSKKDIDSPVKSDVHYDRMNETELEKIERSKSEEPEYKQRKSRENNF